MNTTITEVSDTAEEILILMNTLQNQIADVEEMEETYESEIANLKSERDDLENQVGSLEDELRDLKNVCTCEEIAEMRDDFVSDFGKNLDYTECASYGAKMVQLVRSHTQNPHWLVEQCYFWLEGYLRRLEEEGNASL